MDADPAASCMRQAATSRCYTCTVTQLLGVRQVRERCLECETLWQQSAREFSHTRETDRLADTNSDEERGGQREERREG